MKGGKQPRAAAPGGQLRAAEERAKTLLVDDAAWWQHGHVFGTPHPLQSPARSLAALTLVVATMVTTGARGEVAQQSRTAPQWMALEGSRSESALGVLGEKVGAFAVEGSGKLVGLTGGNGLSSTEIVIREVVSEDPVRGHLDAPNELNPFDYASGSPTRFTDPDGRASVAEMEAAKEKCSRRHAGQFHDCFEAELARYDANREASNNVGGDFWQQVRAKARAAWERAPHAAAEAVTMEKTINAVTTLNENKEFSLNGPGIQVPVGENPAEARTRAYAVTQQTTSETMGALGDAVEENLERTVQGPALLAAQLRQSLKLSAGNPGDHPLRNTLLTAILVVGAQKIAHNKVVHGGPHNLTSKGGKLRDTESHHLIADTSSNLAREHAPAVRMKRKKHYETASWGSSADAEAFQKLQADLVKVGDYDEAFRLGVEDYVKVVGPKEAARALGELGMRIPRTPQGGIDWAKLPRQ